IDDVLVPFVAACIEAYDPFIGHAESGIEIELDERYPPMIKSFKYPATRPSLPKKQSFLSLKGFRAWWNAPSTLPPALQVRFPLNLLVFLFLPIIIPLMILIIIGRFMWKSFKSKKRIRMLEKNDAGNRSAIVKFVSSLGHTVEDAVVEMMEDETAQNVSPGDVEKTPHPTTPPTTSKAPPPTFTYPPIHAPSNPVPSAVQPILTPTQLRIIENLNQLPRLKKGFVWLDGLTNTHATIMCRDINEFEFHRRGEDPKRSPKQEAHCPLAPLAQLWHRFLLYHYNKSYFCVFSAVPTRLLTCIGTSDHDIPLNYHKSQVSNSSRQIVRAPITMSPQLQKRGSFGSAVKVLMIVIPVVFLLLIIAKVAFTMYHRKKQIDKKTMNTMVKQQGYCSCQHYQSCHHCKDGERQDLEMMMTADLEAAGGPSHELRAQRSLESDTTRVAVPAHIPTPPAVPVPVALEEPSNGKRDVAPPPYTEQV
ncbi:hypothetical protein FRB90_002082, partial [Tulasnella sp. 427]